MANPTQEQVNQVLSAYDLAVAAPGYVDTVIMDAEQISGDDYRMVWTDEYTGDFINTAER